MSDISPLVLGAQSKAKPNATEATDDAAVETKKDSIEEKNVGNDPEIRPVVDEGPSQLDEEPDVDQQESLTATEACEGKLEDVTKSLDDKPKKKSTSVLDDSRLVWVLALTRLRSRANNLRALWGKWSKRL